MLLSIRFKVPLNKTFKVKSYKVSKKLNNDTLLKITRVYIGLTLNDMFSNDAVLK